MTFTEQNSLIEMAKESAFQWERLLDIIRIARPHDTKSEREFIHELLRPYSYSVLVDTKGSILAYVIDVEGEYESKTMFSCHVDTVDRKEGYKMLLVKDNELYTDKNSDCLGADDGAGMWLMLEMIDAKVPGCYVFHRGEERGGIGSRGIASTHPQFLASFDRAIAFDRRGTHSVITHQGSRCCSDEFAEALSEELNKYISDNYFFAPDDTGVFTDTANYTDDIEECTNISIGYDGEHFYSESLNTDFLFAMRDACIEVDWEKLPSKRRPGEIDPDDFIPRWDYSWRGTHSMTQAEWDKEFDYYKDKSEKPTYDHDYDATPTVIADATYEELLYWVETSDPENIAEVLYNLLHRDEQQ